MRDHRDARLGRIAGALIAAAVLSGLGLAFWQLAPGELGQRIDADDPERVAEGRAIYVTHCAACHGAALQGQPNWRERRPDGRLPAPPHDASGHTWHHPDAMLFGMVKEGFATGKYAPPGYQSDMPAYAGVLTDRQILAVLAYIKRSWPEKERAHQERLTRMSQ